MSDRIGLLTGSFDPVTLGHMDIISRASKLFDTLYVGIFFNREKQGFFTIDERQHILEEAVVDFQNVVVVTADNSLAVDFANQLGVTCLVRGLRNATDFDYEANLDFFNKQLAKELETIYLIASHEVQPISSSRVRELIHFGVDLEAYVPESVIKEVEKKSGK
ncbi:pantetheine-phosphate adenylyltransferase [Streptococcus saliviloxodontae]|uniref:Phosphopantetheine adenylyltransferase n=1 Tax=Streptococcus saliviloxodontae TaxID=1349416 RepID=A0ABS2PJI5_9STRE|nr:pantetheine-phosphate adenylyltransferase [Streptococcus saliviloxodontae]MBM7635447.1 pantetheine-phosphate adenylyltransferase [Streptococcus saliviloxodontae]